jgi:hypothetical protein
MKRSPVKTTVSTVKTTQVAKTDTESGVLQPLTSGCASIKGRLSCRCASLRKNRETEATDDVVDRLVGRPVNTEAEASSGGETLSHLVNSGS